MPSAEQPEALRDDQAEDPAAVAAERHADADLLAPLRHLVRQHAVDADRGEEQRDRAEQHREHHRRPPAHQRLLDALLHRLAPQKNGSSGSIAVTCCRIALDDATSGSPAVRVTSVMPRPAFCANGK